MCVQIALNMPYLLYPKKLDIIKSLKLSRNLTKSPEISKNLKLHVQQLFTRYHRDAVENHYKCVQIALNKPDLLKSPKISQNL